jgi:hypothetical protein
MSKRFTLREARSLLAQIAPRLHEAMTLKSQYQEAEGAMQSFAQHVMLMGGVLVDRERAGQIKSRRDQAVEQLKAVIGEIQETGCVIKDLDIGLLDFPTLFRGEEVYLCWKLGETDIQFWHGMSEGFAGRKPIDQDFLDHHEGDRPH